MAKARYASRNVKLFGLVHLIVGALSLSLGIASATPSQGSFPYGQIGYGIWGGILYIVNGILALTAGNFRSPDLIVSHMVLSIVVSIVATLQFSLGVASAVQDNALVNIRRGLGIHRLTTTIPPGPTMSTTSPTPSTTIDPEIQRYYNDLQNYYGNGANRLLANLVSDNLYGQYVSNKLTELVHPGTVAVDCLLAITGLMMALVALLSAASGCRVTCCSNFQIEDDCDEGGYVAFNGR